MTDKRNLKTFQTQNEGVGLDEIVKRHLTPPKPSPPTNNTDIGLYIKVVTPKPKPPICELTKVPCQGWNCMFWDEKKPCESLIVE